MSASTLTTIDCHYYKPQFAAAFLRREGDEAAFIDTNTQFALPYLLRALEEQGLKPEQVRYVIVTHAHLDHAAGAHALLMACPNAKLVAHPRAARHLIDPAKLEKSSRQVYGDAAFEKLYGSLHPVPTERVLQPNDGDTLPLGNATLTMLHTRGHAKHHMCILDPGVDAVYTGDSFGLYYPELQARGLFVFPTTSPTDFEADEALATIDRIKACGAKRALLTHFGEVRDIPTAHAQLRAHLLFCKEILEQARALPPAEHQPFLHKRLTEHYSEVLARPEGKTILVDLRLNADGMAWSLQKKPNAS